MGISREDIDQMISLGVLEPAGGKAAQPVAASPAPAEEPKPAASGSGRSKQQRYKDAYPIATQLTGSLGLMLSLIHI